MSEVLSASVRAWLDGPRYAVLATLNLSGSPHLTEMWYELRGDVVIFNTTDDRAKSRNLARDARVSLLVSELKGEATLRATNYVRIDGRARKIADGAQGLADILSLAERYDGKGAGERARPAYSKQHRVTYAIDIRRVYAKGV